MSTELSPKISRYGLVCFSFLLLVLFIPKDTKIFPAKHSSETLRLNLLGFSYCCYYRWSYFSSNPDECECLCTHRIYPHIHSPNWTTQPQNIHHHCWRILKVNHHRLGNCQTLSHQHRSCSQWFYHYTCRVYYIWCDWQSLGTPVVASLLVCSSIYQYPNQLPYILDFLLDSHLSLVGKYSWCSRWTEVVCWVESKQCRAQMFWSCACRECRWRWYREFVRCAHWRGSLDHLLVLSNQIARVPWKKEVW